MLLDLASFVGHSWAFYSYFHIAAVVAVETSLGASCSCCPWVAYPAYFAQVFLGFASSAVVADLP